MKRARHPLLFRLSLAATALALVVVVLGAYVRLSHAGLGCPDWPGCYGRVDVPRHAEDIEQANRLYPQRPVERGKAWKEMIHRYAAGTLGLLIAAMAVVAWRGRRRGEDTPRALTAALLALVVFQALLGMWTVTLLLKPLVVTAHLIGGFATLALLGWLALRTGPWRPAPPAGRADALRPWAYLVLAVIALQVFLGGWTSSNYAALACYGFPLCNGQWWPPVDFSEAFVLWRGLGIDYEGGVLDHPARTAIHLAHRAGAVLVAAVLVLLCVKLWRAASEGVLRGLAVTLGGLFVLQAGLGVANVTLALPLAVATAHNAVAALLVLAMTALIHVLHTTADSA